MKKPQAAQRVFHAPMRLDWTDEKLRALDQDQLVSLLDNLELQRDSGRLAPEMAAEVETRIFALLTPRIARQRRRALAAHAAAAAVPEAPPTSDAPLST